MFYSLKRVLNYNKITPEEHDKNWDASSMDVLIHECNKKGRD